MKWILREEEEQRWRKRNQKEEGPSVTCTFRLRARGAVNGWPGAAWANQLRLEVSGMWPVRWFVPSRVTAASCGTHFIFIFVKRSNQFRKGNIIIKKKKTEKGGGRGVCVEKEKKKKERLSKKQSLGFIFYFILYIFDASMFLCCCCCFIFYSLRSIIVLFGLRYCM